MAEFTELVLAEFLRNPNFVTKPDSLSLSTISGAVIAIPLSPISIKALTSNQNPKPRTSLFSSSPIHSSSLAAKQIQVIMEMSALRGLKLQIHTGNHVSSRPKWSIIPPRHRWLVQCAVRFRPCIDIHKGKVKQIVGSTLCDLNEGAPGPITNFESDKSSAEFANLYKQDGLNGGHVIMLGADAASRTAAVEALHAYPGGMQVGGGINSDNALSYIEEGASHVIVTSFVFSDGQMNLDRLKHFILMIGKRRLVLDLSCRRKNGKYAIVTDRWQKFTDVFLDEQTLVYLATYADEFLVHGVDVEGKRLGIDEELVALLGCCSPIPVTYAGGVTTLADMEMIKVAGSGRVDATVGSALNIFGGDLSYKDVVDWHQKQAYCHPHMHHQNGKSI